MDATPSGESPDLPPNLSAAGSFVPPPTPPPLVQPGHGQGSDAGSGTAAYRPIRPFVDGPGGPPPRRGGSGWLWAILILAGLGAAGFFGLVWIADRFDGADFGTASSHSQKRDDLHETVLESSSAREKIAVIDLQGVISGEALDYEGTTLVSHIEDQLERAANDRNVKAILLKIDSPGGEVLASDEIYKLLTEFQAEHDKPVVASMGTVAASGGYYVAAPCRWIVANELTITGSIGVIMHSYNYRVLMDKVGVRPQVFKSGELKDMLSPDKRDDDITSEERRIVQNLVNETFERFKSVIAEGRALAEAQNEDNDGEEADHGRPLAKNWQEFADGRLLSGKEAWKLGFVDELGDFGDAVSRTLKLAGLEDAKLVEYRRAPSFGSIFRLLGQAPETKVKIDLGLPSFKLRTGLYFLAPNMVR
jgi:protease-4